MNYFDTAIMEFCNRFSQRSETFDTAIVLLSKTEILKAGVVVTILWALWFRRDKVEAVAETRRTVLVTVAGTFVACLLGRLLARALPFRLRPLHQPALIFRIPTGISKGALDQWSSFPSDHAVLMAGLVTGIFLISRRLGFFSIFYAFLFIFFPRIYVGLHYPTDILAGILLGSVCVVSANGLMTRKTITEPLLEWSEKYPSLFYAGFFLVTYQTTQLFNDVRAWASFLLGVLKRVVH